jgi:hypothetical protein
MKYLPFLNGQYSVAPALQPVKKIDSATPKSVFEIDEGYDEYLLNKQACRDEDINKYYLERNLFDKTVVSVNRYIVQQLILEYPNHFTFFQDGDNYVLINQLQQKKLQWKDDWTLIEDKSYVSLFDALASQVQEDLAICQLQDDKDWLAALHICSPNYWSPADKAGHSFDKVHAIIPGMEKGMRHYFKMLTTVVNKGPFIRFAWGITTDKRLNHHPTPAPGADEALWKGRRIEEGCELYCRVEKQTLIGLPQANAFLFAIRTFIYPIDYMEQHEKEALLTAVDTMSLESLQYKGMAGKVELLKQMLSPGTSAV